jgi:leucyl/phenylalanyl-tRNA--protein transferase
MQKPRFFPSPDQARAEGVVAFGGRLTPDWLIDAYTHGIFPWPMACDGSREMLVWFSPDPRAIFELDGFRPSRRLLQTIRSGRFMITCDCDFLGVIQGCATGRRDGGGTWITPSLIAAYYRLFEMGIAHSIEVWQDCELVGGTYGVAIQGLYAGESMFHRVSNASKVALYFLFEHLRLRGYKLFDIQQLTKHTASLGAIEIPRDQYLQRLPEALSAAVTWGDQLESGVEVERPACYNRRSALPPNRSDPAAP